MPVHICHILDGTPNGTRSKETYIKVGEALKACDSDVKEIERVYAINQNKLLDAQKKAIQAAEAYKRGRDRKKEILVEKEEDTNLLQARDSLCALEMVFAQRRKEGLSSDDR